MKAKLAHLYRGNSFKGYGLAVDGQLVDRQVSVEISSHPQKPSIATVIFNLDAEMVENPVRINLDENECLR